MTQAAVYVEKNAISHARTNFVLNAPTLLFAANSFPPFVNRVMVTVLYMRHNQCKPIRRSSSIAAAAFLEVVVLLY